MTTDAFDAMRERHAREDRWQVTLAASPGVGRKDLPRAKREWQGRRVALEWRVSRGHARERSRYRWTFGTLVASAKDEHVTVRTQDGDKAIHYTRVMRLVDLTTKKPPKPV